MQLLTKNSTQNWFGNLICIFVNIFVKKIHRSCYISPGDVTFQNLKSNFTKFFAETQFLDIISSNFD